MLKFIMSHSKFVHLHLHTEYSLLDGAIRLADLSRKAHELKMPAMAITDHGNMFGAIEFYQQMSRAGIKPIIGYEAYIAPTSRFDKSPSSGEGTAHHATLLAKDTTGYENLMKLATLAYLEGFYYKPRIDMELLSLHREGLIFLSGCIKGRAARFISKGQAKEAKDFILSCLDIFGQENLFLELQDNGIEEQAIANQGLARIAGELSLPLVATNDVHYLNKEDAKAHDALLCIQTGKEMKEEKRLKFSTDSFYLRSADEMKALFSDYPQAISNTIEIAERCNLELDLDNKEKFYLPHYEIQPSAFSLQPSEEGLDDYLANLSHQGLIERYGEPTKEQKDRLDYELKVIKQMGFASYFLIVWDLICYAQDEEIAVGPGRGSAAGSLVSYCLKITDVDPLRYDLLFERFLNPERISMPDIDIDFEDERREEIISYLVKKYGQENIAHIITFGKMLAKQVIRDVGRVLGFPYGDVDKIAKLIPAGKTTLNGAILEVPELAALREDKKFKKIFDIALRLEGLVRHASTHAAAVVISEKPLTNFTPLYKDPKEGTVTTQYAMGPIEAIGLLKMDFLGLRNLTTIKEAVRLIKESKEEEVDIHNIPLDDKATFKLLCRAEGIGLFQLESSGMRDLLRKLKPECFEDLIALLALYRPGPLGSGMVDEFIRGKRKKKRVSYIHPKLSEVLEGTYGVIVYQEQVMKIAQLAANFTLSQADELRKAMSKKMHSQMDSLRASFLEGAVHNGILKGQAEKIFELIFKFAEYGFNKSHSAAYALISYRTAYLKAHYPVEFMAALLTSELSKTDKVHLYISECQRLKIKILPPDINQSVTDFKVGKKPVPGSARGKEIRFGLGAIKNVGEKAIKEIVRQRKEKGDFKSLYDFCERLDLRLVNKRVIESLIKAGCFDSLGAKRSQLAASSDHALEVASKIQKDRESGQVSFLEVFDKEEGFSQKYQQLEDIPEWPENKLLSHEKEVLGLYLTSHPLAKYEEELASYTTLTIAQLKELESSASVTIGGVILSFRTTNTKKGEMMSYINLEDLSGNIEVLVFPGKYNQFKDEIVQDRLVIIKGRAEKEEDRIKFFADEIIPLSSARQKLSADLHIKVKNLYLEEEALLKLKKIMEKYKGDNAVYLHLQTAHHGEVVISPTCKVSLRKEMEAEIKKVLGEESIRLKVGGEGSK